MNPQLRREVRAVLDSLWAAERDRLTTAGRDKLAAARRLIDLDEFESQQTHLSTALQTLSATLIDGFGQLAKRLTRRT